MSETATEPTPAPSEPQAPSGPPPQQAASPPEPQQPAGNGQEPPAQPQSGVEELPPWAQRELKKLRDESAGHRVKAKEHADALAQFKADQEEQRLRMGRALGYITDEPPSADELTRRLEASNAKATEAQTAARATRVELAVFRAAAAAGVDANALLDSRSFVSQIVGLDDAAEDFGAKVKSAIDAAVEQRPQYKTTPSTTPPPPAVTEPPAVPKSGADGFTGAPQGPRQWTEEDVDRATPAQLTQAINDGLCQNLGFGPKRGSRR